MLLFALTLVFITPNNVLAACLGRLRRVLADMVRGARRTQGRVLARATAGIAPLPRPSELQHHLSSTQRRCGGSNPSTVPYYRAGLRRYPISPARRWAASQRDVLGPVLADHGLVHPGFAAANAPPAIPERKVWLYIMSAGISAVYTGFYFAVALAVGFPVPFSYLTLDMVWISLIVGGLWIYIGPTCRASATVRQCLKKHAIFIYAASSLAVVYPLFYYAFLCAREYASVQLLLTFALPIIKMMEKLLLYRTTAHASDLQPVFIAFNVDVFNALFVSSCMRNSTSMSVTTTLMMADFVGACAALYGLQNTIVHIDALNSKLGRATRVQMVEIAALIAYRQHPDTLIEAEGTRELQATAAVTPWPTHEANENSENVLDSPSSPSKIWMKKASVKMNAIVPAVTSSLSPFRRGPSVDEMASRTSSIRIMEQLSPKERQNFVHQTCRLLRRVEFLLLVEYTEVMVPMVYGKPKDNALLLFSFCKLANDGYSFSDLHCDSVPPAKPQVFPVSARNVRDRSGKHSSQRDDLRAAAVGFLRAALGCAYSTISAHSRNNTTLRSAQGVACGARSIRTMDHLRAAVLYRACWYENENAFVSFSCRCQFV